MWKKSIYYLKNDKPIYIKDYNDIVQKLKNLKYIIKKA